MSEELKYRLNQFEVSPPGDAWRNISSALDEWGEWQPVSDRLLNFEVTPPPGNWQNIEHGLETQVIDIKKPVRKIGSVIYQVAASVILVTLMVSGVWKFFQPSSIDKSGVEEKVLQNASVNNNALSPSFPIDIQKSTKQVKINSGAKNYINVKYTRFKTDAPLHKRSINYSSIESSKWLTKEMPIVIDAPPIPSNETESKSLVISNGQRNNYFYLTDAEGNPFRVSVKFADIVLFLNNLTDNTYPEEISNSETIRWKNLINEWREKIIRSGYSPASANFLDIVELSAFLRKNQ